MLTAAQEANPPTKEVSKNGFSFRHPDAPPPFQDVSLPPRARPRFARSKRWGSWRRRVESSGLGLRT